MKFSQIWLKTKYEIKSFLIILFLYFGYNTLTVLNPKYRNLATFYYFLIFWLPFFLHLVAILKTFKIT